MLELTSLKSSNTSFEQSQKLSFEDQQDIVGGATGVPGASTVGRYVGGATGAFVGSALARRYFSNPNAPASGGFIGAGIGATAGTLFGASLSE